MTAAKPPKRTAADYGIFLPRAPVDQSKSFAALSKAVAVHMAVTTKGLSREGAELLYDYDKEIMETLPAVELLAKYPEYFI